RDLIVTGVQTCALPISPRPHEKCRFPTLPTMAKSGRRGWSCEREPEQSWRRSTPTETGLRERELTNPPARGGEDRIAQRRDHRRSEEHTSELQSRSDLV